MQIYGNKRNVLHKKRVQPPQDLFGTPTWPPFIVLENQYGRDVMWIRSICRLAKERKSARKGLKATSIAPVGLHNLTAPLRSFSNDDGDVNENGKKAIGLDWQNNNICTCITLFSAFLFCYYTTTTWKCLISRFEEDVKNTRQRLSYSFLELRRSLLEFKSTNLTNWTRWNKCYKVCSSATSLFKRHFLNRGCRCCLRVPIIISASSQKSRDLKVRVSVLLYTLIAFGARWARVDLAKEEFSFFFFLQKSNIVFHHISYWTRRKLKNCLVKLHKEFDLTSQTI